MDEHEKNCDRCQAVQRAAWSIRTKRLGKHERRLLLNAAPPDKKPKPVYPPGPSQAEQTATRRAIANLVAHGLIELAPEQLRLQAGDDDEALARLGRKYAVLRMAWRTPLGDAIVHHYRKQLRGSERIRWMYHLDAATEMALDGCPVRSEAQSLATRIAKKPKLIARSERATQRGRPDNQPDD
jgi:hypothetical protein